MKKKIIKFAIIIILILILILMAFACSYYFKNRNENIYYNSSILESYILDVEAQNSIKIAGVTYSEQDMRLREYFYGEKDDTTRREVIDTIIFSTEARRRKLKVETEIQEEIKKRINNYKFSDEFLDTINYDEEELKEKMIETCLDIEFELNLKIHIQREILQNNITIENDILKSKVQAFFDKYNFIKKETPNSTYTEEEINNIYSQYTNEVEELTNEYLNSIRNNIKVENL